MAQSVFDLIDTVKEKVSPMTDMVASSGLRDKKIGNGNSVDLKLSAYY